VAVMSRFESAVCRSAPWRATTRRLVLPWALQGLRPTGDVLEVGAGSGAFAEEVLRSFPSTRVTATDVDPAMVAAIARRLAPFGGRVTAEVADAGALPFADGSFDVVVSCLMVHHTPSWSTTLDEARRVLRPGGHLVGFDLLPSRLLGAAHRRGHHASRVHPVSLHELRTHLGPTARVTRARGGLVVRFLARVD
jgi:ubiquinone/menaquinone biosynthesis C-methylase UbiE